MSIPVVGANEGIDRRRVRGVGRPSITDYPPGATHGPRTLVDYEFVWLLHGSAVLDSAVDDIAIAPGELLLLGPGWRHTIRWDPARATRHGYVHFALRAGLEPLTQTWLLRRPFTTDDPLAALCRYLVWFPATRGPGWAGRVDAVLEALLDIFLDGPLPESRSSMSATLETVLAHLSKRWSSGRTSALRLDELAAAASVSVGQLNRTFRSEVGSSPVATVELLRLARAERLVARSAMTVAAIADATGFADQYHFSRRFRRRFGMAPTAYRRVAAVSEPVLPGDIVAVLPLIDRLLLPGPG